MTTVHAKAFRITEHSREIVQCFIPEPIPEDTKFILTSSEGYVFFDEELPVRPEPGVIRIPHMTMLSYYDIDYESE